MDDNNNPFESIEGYNIPNIDNNLDDLNTLLYLKLSESLGYALTNHIVKILSLNGLELKSVEDNPRALLDIFYNIFGKQAEVLEKELVKILYSINGIRNYDYDDLEIASLRIRLHKKPYAMLYERYIYDEIDCRSKNCKMCNSYANSIYSLASLCKNCFKSQEGLVEDMLYNRC